MLEPPANLSNETLRACLGAEYGLAVAEVVGEPVQRGLLARASDPRDRRAYQLTLTEAGGSLLRRARLAVMEQEAALIAPFAHEEASELRRLLRLLAASAP